MIFHPLRLICRMLILVTLVSAGLLVIGSIEAGRSSASTLGMSELISLSVSEPGVAVEVVQDRLTVAVDELVERGTGVFTE